MVAKHWQTNKHTLGTVNQARALRLAEIINDYRTLLLHIPQQNVHVPADDYYEEGFVVIRESLAAAQNLMSSNYSPSMPANHGSTAETEKAELRRYGSTSLDS